MPPHQIKELAAGTINAFQAAGFGGDPQSKALQETAQNTKKANELLKKVVDGLAFGFAFS